MRCLLLVAGLMALPLLSHADAGDDKPFKLTVADYRYSDGYDGHDLNLRWRHGDTDAWVGAYRDKHFGDQVRAGIDSSFAPRPWAALAPTLELASRGFVGASLNLQLGDPWFVSAGWGRTNGRPFFNLNFDPNDDINLGVGWRGDDGRTVSLTLIADDRFHTGQRDWHLFGRWPLGDGRRLTVDVLRKSGDGDDGPVRTWGASATLDFPSWFVRLARDPKQNFSSQDATRVAVGWRF